MLKAEIIGNLGGDAEVKVDNGRRYVQFSVADSRKYVTKDGVVQETTNWVSCFWSLADSEAVKYLKSGTRVFVRGNAELRIYSSQRERQMKAGLTINVQELELVGSLNSDVVPRELYKDDKTAVQVNKAYFVQGLDDVNTLYDRRGNPYDVKNGWVVPHVEQNEQTGQNQ